MTEHGVEAGADLVLSSLHLSREYHSSATPVSALDGVSLEIKRGAFVAVMGPSGSGKSTLLHLLAGLDRPTRGDVVIDGQRLSALDERELTRFRRSKVGIIFQSFNLVGVLTALQNVALPLTLARVPRADALARADEVLAAVGLRDLADRRPSQMSGGEQQRVAIARALAPKPSVLFADEPTGSLDSENSDHVVELLRRAHRDLDQTVVVATHDPRVAASADEVVRLHDGAVAGILQLGRGRRREGSAARSILSWLNEPAAAVGAEA